MPTLRRPLGALLLVLIAVTGMVERSALHGHALGELDLSAHALSSIAPGPACGQGAHFDAASPSHHLVCPECTLAAASLAAGPAATARLARPPVRPRREPTAAPRTSGRPVGVADARGPPHA